MIQVGVFEKYEYERKGYTPANLTYFTYFIFHQQRAACCLHSR